MRVARLFLPLALRSGEEIELPEDRAHYLADVLRLRSGSSLVLFNGEGGEFAAEVVAAHRRGARVRVGHGQPGVRESPLQIHLGLGISRGERMDLAIQKAVELGVSAITPLATERSVVKLDTERRRARWDHWLKVAQSASEQSVRTRVPEVFEPRPLDVWLAAGDGLRLLLDPRGQHAMKELSPLGDQVRLLSGPEGGFSAEERSRAHAAGFLSVRLGPRVLRTETAAIVALAAAQLLWGDLGI